jgi:hypothetical protein
MGWFFHESDPMGGAAGEAFANTLKSPGMHPEHVLAREAIQNSVDAGLSGQKVEVRFRATVVSGAKKASFVAAAGLKDIAARARELQLAGLTCLSTLDKPRTALQLLYVEDYNAEGLSGDPHDKGSNFYRLLLSLGDRSKSRQSQGTGGSYGFGKSVYSSSSAIQTIFAYTRFKGAGGKECTRIFGCGYFVSHDYANTAFSGRAWLGAKHRKDNSGRVVVDPLENREADTLAEELGFALRGPKQLGTSILIVDADVKTEAIVRGVEEWWWPRLVENKLDVLVQSANGDKHFPKPRKVGALRPFIEAFDIAKTRTSPTNGTQKYALFNKEGGVAMGACGFVVVPVDSNGVVTVSSDRCNSVALIRGPLMVVSYHSVSQSSPIVVGAYVAPEVDEVEQALRKSEPPAHDRWDPESTNLRDADGGGRKVVEAVLSRIRSNLRRFQSEAAPPTPAKQRRLTQLERALGSYFKPQGVGAPASPDVAPSPLHLEFMQQPYAEAADENMLRLRSSFVIRLDESAEEGEVDLRLTVHCPVLEDDNEEGEDLRLVITPKGVAVKWDSTNPATCRFALARGSKAKFDIESEAYDPAWTVRLRPDIEREGA